jgi:hypothetical protein
VRKLVLLLALVAAALPAADFSGIWLGSATTGRRNQIVDFGFQFVQKGAVLSGKAYMDYGTTPILKGTIEGDKITFEIVAREQAGNETSESVFKFTGVMKDGELEVTRERQEIRNTVNAAAGFARPAPPLVFKIKRLP